MWGQDWGTMVSGGVQVPTIGALGILLLGMALVAGGSYSLGAHRARRGASARPGVTAHVIVLLGAAWLLLVPVVTLAGNVATPNVFVNGQVADADAVNANFQAHETEINDNDARVAALEAIANVTATSIVNADGTTQFVSIPGTSVVRTSVGNYTVTIPDGTWSGGNALHFAMPLGLRFIGGTSILTSVGGGATVTLAMVDAMGAPADTVFTILVVGPRT